MPGGGWYIKWGPTAPSAGKEQLVICFGLAQDGSSVVPLVASGQGFITNATDISDDWVLDHPAQWEMATFMAVSLREGNGDENTNHSGDAIPGRQYYGGTASSPSSAADSTASIARERSGMDIVGAVRNVYRYRDGRQQVPVEQ